MSVTVTQTLLVVGVLLGMVVIAVLWAADHPFQYEDDEPEDDEVFDEDGFIFAPGQFPRRGDL